MTAARRFRFGVGSEGIITAQAAWDSLVRRAEELGYATFLVPDHYTDGLTPVAALMAAADAAKTIRIGTFVFNNDLRHPAQLAKEAATLDLLSSGRFELGIGAGWNKVEYDQIGSPFDRPGVRIERLAEAITILKQFFTQESVTFAGTYYRVTGLASFPKSSQRPHPPIFIGGGGERVLSLAAREANIVGFSRKINADGTVDPDERAEAALQRKVAWVRQVAGERFDSLELNIEIKGIAITANRQQAAEAVAQERLDHAGATAITPEELLVDPQWLIGSVDEVVDQLQRLRQVYGISYFMVDSAYMEMFAPVVARLVGE
jgi:probable F420-dependent oxidoreductase